MTLNPRLRATRDGLMAAVAVLVELLIWGGGSFELRNGATLPVVLVPLLTAVTYALLLLRGRYPLSVFAAQWLFALIALFVPEFAPFIGLLVGLHAVATRMRLRVAGFALAFCAVPFAI